MVSAYWTGLLGLFTKRNVAINFRGDGGDGWIVENSAERKINVEGLLNLGEKLSAEERMSAEKEEVVVRIDMVNL